MSSHSGVGGSSGNSEYSGSEKTATVASALEIRTVLPVELSMLCGEVGGKTARRIYGEVLEDLLWSLRPRVR